MGLQTPFPSHDIMIRNIQRQLHGFAPNDAVQQNVLPANTLQASRCIQEKTQKMYGKSVLQAVCVLDLWTCLQL